MFRTFFFFAVFLCLLTSQTTPAYAEGCSLTGESCTPYDGGHHWPPTDNNACHDSESLCHTYIVYCGDIPFSIRVCFYAENSFTICDPICSWVASGEEWDCGKTQVGIVTINGTGRRLATICDPYPSCTQAQLYLDALKSQWDNSGNTTFGTKSLFCNCDTHSCY